MTTAIAINIGSEEAASVRDEYASSYSDFFKDAHGFRPRHSTAHWTVQDFKDEFEKLGRTCRENEIQREQEEAAAIVQFEAEVQRLIGLGAADRAAAIRWLDDAEHANGDRSYLCFCLGLPYGFFDKE